MNKKNICSNISKTECLKYVREVMNLLNVFLNCNSKYVLKGAIPEIEKKQNKLRCESNPSEKYEQNTTKKYFTLKTQVFMITSFAININSQNKILPS